MRRQKQSLGHRTIRSTLSDKPDDLQFSRAQCVPAVGVRTGLRTPGADLRLFGKPESFVKRRMGVALAHDADVERARVLAKEAAGKVTPKAAD